MKKTTSKQKEKECTKMAARTTTAPAATPLKGNDTNIEKVFNAFAKKHLSNCLLDIANMDNESDIKHYSDFSVKSLNTLKKPSFLRFLRHLGIIDNAGKIDKPRLETAARLFSFMQRTLNAFCEIGPLHFNYNEVQAGVKAID